MLVEIKRTVSYFFETDNLHQIQHKNLIDRIDNLSLKKNETEALEFLDEYFCDDKHESCLEDDYIDSIKVYSTWFGNIDQLEYEYKNPEALE